MFEFKELNSIESSERVVKIKKIEPTIKKKTAKILSLASNVDLLMESGDFTNMQFAEHDLVKESMLLANYVRSSVIEKGDMSILSKACEDIIKVRVEVAGDIMKIVFSELLPKKVKNGDLRDLGNEMSTYANSLNKALEPYANFTYNEKVVLCFWHIYTSESDLIDHDNIEIKTVKDTIAVNLLPDDNPKWCSEHMDYKIGEYKHSEIDIVPARTFGNYITNMKH